MIPYAVVRCLMRLGNNSAENRRSCLIAIFAILLFFPSCYFLGVLNFWDLPIPFPGMPGLMSGRAVVWGTLAFVAAFTAAIGLIRLPNTMRRIWRKLHERNERQKLMNLMKSQGPKGKWFTAAEVAGYMDIALECAGEPSADPGRLILAAHDYVGRDPKFAILVALYAMINILAGGGDKPTASDMAQAHSYFMAAVVKMGEQEWALDQVKRLVAEGTTSDCRDLGETLRIENQRYVQ